MKPVCKYEVVFIMVERAAEVTVLRAVVAVILVTVTTGEMVAADGAPRCG